MRYIVFSLILLGFSFTKEKELDKVNKVLDDWHLAAANADFEAYFGTLLDESVFIGTAPGERWTKAEFISFAKPFFDKGKAWDFKSQKRNVSFSEDGKTAWFDEVLSTWMKDCSGSGVLKKVKGEWKIMLYDLHVLIENEKIDAFLDLRGNEK